MVEIRVVGPDTTEADRLLVSLAALFPTLFPQNERAAAAAGRAP
jgi:hypothetical protein